jgi:hypothetical protein
MSYVKRGIFDNLQNKQLTIKPYNNTEFCYPKRGEESRQK